MKLHTERVTTLLITGNVGYDNFLQLNSSSLQNYTDYYIEKKLPINTTSENNAAPIQLSIMILLCLGAILLGFYIASYKIEYFTVLKELICQQNANNKNFFD